MENVIKIKLFRMVIKTIMYLNITLTFLHDFIKNFKNFEMMKIYNVHERNIKEKSAPKIYQQIQLNYYQNPQKFY